MKPNQVHKTCKNCGKQYSVKASEDARSHYCSKLCMNTAKRMLFASAFLARTGEDLAAYLQKGIESGVLMQTMAEELNINYRTLLRFIRDYGLTRRPRSESIKLQWADNEERRQAQRERQIEATAALTPEERQARSLHANTVLQSTSPTGIERRLMAALDEAGIRYKFQYQVGEKFLCDFGFPESMLIVECDGTYWHSTPKQRKRDASKDAYLQACGYTVLRISDKQIEHYPRSCVEAIKHLI